MQLRALNLAHANRDAGRLQILFKGRAPKPVCRRLRIRSRPNGRSGLMSCGRTISRRSRRGRRKRIVNTGRRRFGTLSDRLIWNAVACMGSQRPLVAQRRNIVFQAVIAPRGRGLPPRRQRPVARSNGSLRRRGKCSQQTSKAGGGRRGRGCDRLLHGFEITARSSRQMSTNPYPKRSWIPKRHNSAPRPEMEHSCRS